MLSPQRWVDILTSEELGLQRSYSWIGVGRKFPARSAQKFGELYGPGRAEFIEKMNFQPKIASKPYVLKRSCGTGWNKLRCHWAGPRKVRKLQALVWSYYDINETNSWLEVIQKVILMERHAKLRVLCTSFPSRMSSLSSISLPSLVVDFQFQY